MRARRNQFPMFAIREKQGGVALVAALFLIVVLAMLGVFAVRIGTAQQQTVNLSLLSSRALAAANSGIEYGANQALHAGVCPSTAVQFSLPAQGVLNGFTVEVSCQSVGGGMFQLTSKAWHGTFGSPDFAFSKLIKTMP